MIGHRRLRRIFAAGFLLTIFLTITVVVFGFYSYRRPLPQTDGTLSVPGLRDNVTIYRDAWGVPHIYAANAHDLFFAQGYTHAQDRWWQMEMSRHIGHGRLSAILGEDFVESDQIIHTLGWNRIAAVRLANTSPEALATLEAFSAGVNAYIMERNPSDLAVQYTILGITGRNFEVAPWEPIDSLAWLTAFGWQLESGANLQTELQAAALLDQFGIAPSDYNNHLSPANSPDIDAALMLEKLFISPMFQQDISAGSTAWVVSGSHTDSGLPLLANSYNLRTDIPVGWYEVGLHCVEITENCPYDVIGVSVPGIPAVFAGHNRSIAWSLSTAYIDTQDVYRLPAAQNNRYELDDVVYDLTAYSEIMPNETVFKTYDSPHGLIIAQENDYMLALQWSGANPKGDTISALLSLNRANAWDEFRNALQLWDWTPHQFLYADVGNNIGYQLAGTVPIRLHDGSLPAEPSMEWDGMTRFEALPSYYNPAAGWLVTADSRPEVDNTSSGIFLSHSIGATDIDYQTERIVAQLADAHHNPDSFARVQNDLYNAPNVDLMERVVNLPVEDARLSTLQQWLKEWDAQNRIDSPQALLLGMVWAEIGNIVLPSITDVPLPIIQALFNNERVSDDVLAEAFLNAATQADQSFGTQQALWRWGDLHQTTFTSHPLGEDGPIGFDLLNRDGIETGGSWGSIESTVWQVEDSYPVIIAASYRMIIDLDDFENSRAILNTGQSGHPASAHYDDMIPLWRSGEYHDMGWLAIREQALSTLRLRP